MLGLHETAHLGTGFDLGATRTTALRAHVFVFVALGDNEQQTFSHRDGAPASGACEKAGLDALEGRSLLRCHELIKRYSSVPRPCKLKRATRAATPGRAVESGSRRDLRFWCQWISKV